MTRPVLSFRGRGDAEPWRARGRFLAFAGLGLLSLAFPPWGGLAVAAASLALGRRERWLAWFAALGWFWLIVLAPLVAEALAALAALPTAGGQAWSSGAWGEAAGRCLAVLALLMASQWYVGATSVLEVREVLAWILRPLGRRAAGRVAFLAALAIGFIPWALDELAAVDEAARVRSGGRRSLADRFRPFGVPLFARVLAKARHVAEAIELRGGFDPAA